MYILEFYTGNFSLWNFSLHNTVPYIYMNRTTKSVVVREGWNEWVVMSDCVNFCRRLESTSSSSLLATLQPEGGPKQSQEIIKHNKYSCTGIATTQQGTKTLYRSKAQIENVSAPAIGPRLQPLQDKMFSKQNDILLTIAEFHIWLLWAGSFRGEPLGYHYKTKRVPGLVTMTAWLASLALRSMPQGVLHGSTVSFHGFMVPAQHLWLNLLGSRASSIAPWLASVDQ